MPNDRIDATQFFLWQKLKTALLWCIYAFHYYMIMKFQKLVTPRTIRRPSITPRDLECMLCDETVDPTALPLSLLEEITDGFSDKQEIGRGGFAVVYKGKLENRTVAVKKMSNTYMYEKEFHREVECLMMAKHPNVVRFLGYCADTQGTMARHEGKFVMADVQQRLLCFEYLSKGSLHEYITDTSRKLRWRDSYQIITGICQGLHYLHRQNIVHFDLKPQNILLDDNLVAKIADFGLSRCFIGETKSRVMSKIGGTRGYWAPECFNGHTQIRHLYRLDIYSLGVVIMEILTREMESGEKEYRVVDNVCEHWSNMLEKSQRDGQLEQVRVCAEIGIECTDLNPAKRPDIQHIINRLDGTKTMDKYILENATAVTVAGTNPCNNIWENSANLDKLYETMHSLNPNVRRFLEFCSIFPRRSNLRRDDLVRLWMAQGFVTTSCATDDLEDIAEGYIKELVSCSFLQSVGTGSATDWFTIHEVLHDILDKVAGNCFRIENASRHRGEGWEGEVPRDTHHLLIQNYDGELITETIIGLEYLRTLIVYVVEKGAPVEEKVIESICKRLPKLRVLAVAFSKEHGPIEQPNKFIFPEAIGQLKYLRYLAFRTHRSCKITLPSMLNKLQHIQLLDFREGDILEFTFPELVNLRHIFCWPYLKLAYVGRLSSLQTLAGFRVSNEQGCELKQLRGLNKLRGKLCICDLENVKSKDEALEANLAAKERLTELTLEWGLTELTLEWGFDDDTRRSPEVEADVLDGLCPPVGLQKLGLCRFAGWRYPDWMVGKHSGGPKYLQELVLWKCSQPLPGSGLAEAFPHLRVLWFWYCSWDALPENMEHLTSLKELVISKCENIRSLPTLPQCLEVFRVYSCNAEFRKSCETVGHPNWQKIEHVPKKAFR